jgi:hypothetical protein
LIKRCSKAWGICERGVDKSNGVKYFILYKPAKIKEEKGARLEFYNEDLKIKRGSIFAVMVTGKIKSLFLIF